MYSSPLECGVFTSEERDQGMQQSCIKLMDMVRQGDTIAMMRLADCSRQRYIKDPNGDQGFHLYHLAARMGRLNACNSVALRYGWNFNHCTLGIDSSLVGWLVGWPTGAHAETELGQGVAKDMREAVKWYRVGANAQFPTATMHLGDCYRYYYQSLSQLLGQISLIDILVSSDGEGIERDLVMAHHYWQKAHELGERDALYRIQAHPLPLSERHNHENGVYPPTTVLNLTHEEQLNLAIQRSLSVPK
jgi:TPR repeat protein